MLHSLIWPWSLICRNFTSARLCHLDLMNSDHSGLEMSMEWRNIRRPAASSKRVVWKYAQADFGKACSLIEGTNWDTLINDINVSLKNWQNWFLSIIEECIPKQILPRRRNLPWMSKNLVRAMRKWNSLYRQTRKHQNSRLFNCYKEERNRVVRELRRAKRDYFSETSIQTIPNSSGRP